MAEIKLRARIHGARALGRRFLRAAGLIKPDLREELARLMPVHSRIMKTVAPKRSGELASEIRPRPSGSGYEIISPVRSEEGFPYTGVTRFGHRVAFIYPHSPDGALHFTIGGRSIFAKRVRGYHPASDWARKGFPPAVAATQQSAQRLGRRIAAQL